jgi:hypothetical protein
MYGLLPSTQILIEVNGQLEDVIEFLMPAWLPQTAAHLSQQELSLRPEVLPALQEKLPLEAWPVLPGTSAAEKGICLFWRSVFLIKVM